MFYLLRKTAPESKKVETTILYSSPPNNSTDVPIDKNIFIYLNSSVKNISVETDPNFVFEVLKADKKFEIKPKVPLEKNTNYKIEISSKAIKNSPFEINFRTGNIMETALKQDSALLLKIKGKIPVYSSYFDLTYLEEKDSFAVIINSSECKEAKESAFSYLRKNGVNPNKVKILWFEAEGADASCVKAQ